jgi:hypothetical protein
MTAAEIIDGIKGLSPEEQAGVVRFVYRLDAERKLSGPELSALAQRFITATDPDEASRAREEIVRGFYGGKVEALDPAPQSPARVA